MSTKTIQMDKWAGQYAIANSAGPINVEDNRYQTLSQAKEAARMASMGGWLGECWPVRITYSKSIST